MCAPAHWGCAGPRLVQVTRSGLQNAVSVAGMVLTTQAVITEKVKPKAAAAAGGRPAPGSMATGNMPPGYMSL